MKLEHYKEIAFKALELAKANMAEGLSIEEIARRVGYSPARLREIFQMATGRSMIEHILDWKIEEAKRFLSQTDLTITEVALESGFGTHEHFSRTFRKKVGLSPSQFRNKNLIGIPSLSAGNFPVPRARAWFSQAFAGEDFWQEFQSHDGSVTQREGYIEGQGAASSFGLFLKKPLPENVEINFEVKLLSLENGGHSHVLFSFSDEAVTSFWYVVAIELHNQGSCTFKQLNVDRRIIANPPLKPDQWQMLQIHLFDDLLKISLDGQCLFAYRNDFPPLYKQRCTFRLGTYKSDAHFRNLFIKDLGIPALVRSIRQGDALYNAKAFEAAREYYGRLLEMQTAPDDAPELHYKIGMCFFSQQMHSQARAWLEMASTQDKAKFWSEQARSNLMRLDLMEHKEAGIVMADKFLESAETRDETRNALESVCRYYSNRGDYERSILLKTKILKNCGASQPLRCRALLDMAEALEQLAQFKECERTIEMILTEKAVPQELRILALRQLSYVQLLQGELAQSELSLDKMQQEASNPSDRADCDIRRTFVFRARGETGKALELLQDVASRTEIPVRCARAMLESSLIYSGLCEAAKAREAIENARELSSVSHFQQRHASLYAYAPEFVAGEFVRAVDLLMAGARAEYTAVLTHGFQAMLAGFIAQISGNEKISRRIWAEIIRRFPVRRCAYFAPLAEKVLKNEMPDLRHLPLGNQRLSELHFLAALAWEKSGDLEKSRQLLEICVALDVTQRWPAYLSKQKLSGKNNCPP